MPPLLMRAVIAITLALILYSIGVWSEHWSKRLNTVHLVFFWMGLLMDITGTRLMSMISSQNANTVMSIHGITGLVAIVLMLIHAVWATIVIVQGNESARHTFHRFSIIVWIIWLIPFIIGMLMGMK